MPSSLAISACVQPRHPPPDAGGRCGVGCARGLKLPGMAASRDDTPTPEIHWHLRLLDADALLAALERPSAWNQR